MAVGTVSPQQRLGGMLGAQLGPVGAATRAAGANYDQALKGMRGAVAQLKEELAIWGAMLAECLPEERIKKQLLNLKISGIQRRIFRMMESSGRTIEKQQQEKLAEWAKASGMAEQKELASLSKTLGWDIMEDTGYVRGFERTKMAPTTPAYGETVKAPGQVSSTAGEAPSPYEFAPSMEGWMQPYFAMTEQGATLRPFGAQDELMPGQRASLQEMYGWYKGGQPQTIEEYLKQEPRFANWFAMHEGLSKKLFPKAGGRQKTGWRPFRQ